MVGALMLTSAMPVFATPKQMSDGTVFDVEYYATNNPDVVAALGTDEAALYGHYINNGKNEGRKPCADNVTTETNAPTASGVAVTLPEGSIQKVNRNLSPFPYELYTLYFDNKGLPYMYGRDSSYHLYDNGDHENPIDGQEWFFCLNTVNDYCRTMEDIYKRVPGYEDYYMPRQEAVGEVNGTHITLTYVRIFRGYDMGADLSDRGILSTWP